MINNFEELKWCVTQEEGLFWTIKVIDRGNPKGFHHDYYVRTREGFERKFEEARKVADALGVRVMFDPSPHSTKEVAWKVLRELTDHLYWGQPHKARSLYESCAARSHVKRGKVWVIDIDGENPEGTQEIVEEEISEYIYQIVPSKSGIHILSEPFDPTRLRGIEDVDLKKCALTNLYIPEGAK